MKYPFGVAGFLTENGKRKASVILSTENQSCFQVTQIKMKVSLIICLYILLRVCFSIKILVDLVFEVQFFFAYSSQHFFTSGA